MRQLLALVLVGCASGACPAPQAAAGDGQTIALATYNMNFGLAGDSETLDALAAIDADVVLLQETNPEWERAIRAELGERYPHMAFEAPGDYPASGSAILSRVPIEETERLESAVGWFHAQRAIVTVRGERLQLLNVHLKPPVDGGSPILGVTSTGAQREREMRAHLTRLQPGVPTLIAGDFNEGEADVIAMLARERAMHDAFDGAVCGTWHWRYASVELHQSLDHIVLDPGVHAVASWVERVGRSDHFPVVARLSVGPT